VKEKVKEKQKAYATLMDSKTNEEKEVYKMKYKDAKKLAKKAVTLSKNNAFERLCQKLETKEGEKGVFKLARAREKRTRDLGNIGCVKGDDCKVLVVETKITE